MSTDHTEMKIPRRAGYGVLHPNGKLHIAVKSDTLETIQLAPGYRIVALFYYDPLPEMKKPEPAPDLYDFVPSGWVNEEPSTDIVTKDENDAT